LNLRELIIFLTYLVDNNLRSMFGKGLLKIVQIVNRHSDVHVVDIRVIMVVFCVDAFSD